MRGAIQTVTRPILPFEAGVTDAHNHLWVAPAAPFEHNLPLLDVYGAIVAELVDYRRAGGRSVLDSQPGGAGRDANVLAQMSRESAVHIVACTGFDRPIHYPRGYWLWRASEDEICDHFVMEIDEACAGSQEGSGRVRAGYVKMALTDDLTQTRPELVAAAAQAAAHTGAALAVETDRGAQADKVVDLLEPQGILPERIILYGADRCLDLALHRDLAQASVLLAYDVFYQPGLESEPHVWPLLEQMVGVGLAGSIALGTGMSHANMWSRLGGAPGLPALVTDVLPRLQALGLDAVTIGQLLGRNIAARLVRTAQ